MEAWTGLPDDLRAQMRGTEVGCGRLVLHAVENAVAALAEPPQQRGRVAEEFSVLAVALEGATPRAAAFLLRLSEWVMEPILEGELVEGQSEADACCEAAELLARGSRFGPALVVAHCGLAWSPDDERLKQVAERARAGLRLGR